jgi:hypothetical protein
MVAAEIALIAHSAVSLASIMFVVQERANLLVVQSNVVALVVHVQAVKHVMPIMGNVSQPVPVLKLVQENSAEPLVACPVEAIMGAVDKDTLAADLTSVFSVAQVVAFAILPVLVVVSVREDSAVSNQVVFHQPNGCSVVLAAPVT